MSSSQFETPWNGVHREYLPGSAQASHLHGQQADSAKAENRDAIAQLDCRVVNGGQREPGRIHKDHGFRRSTAIDEIQ